MHFPDTDIIRDITKTNLKPNVVPSIFPNLPKYLSKTIPTPRKNPEERTRAIQDCTRRLIEDFERSDIIENFGDLTLNYENKISVSDCWIVKPVSDSHMYFYILDLTDECIKIINQVSIYREMIVKVFLNGNKLDFNDLKWVLPITMKLTTWSQLQNILSRYKNLNCAVKKNTEYYLQQGLQYLNRALSLSNEDNSDLDSDRNSDTFCLSILIDQLNLIILKKKRYSTSTIIMAFMLYTISPCAYELMSVIVSCDCDKPLNVTKLLKM